jgi:hypothetical protein
MQAARPPSDDQQVVNTVVVDAVRFPEWAPNGPALRRRSRAGAGPPKLRFANILRSSRNHPEAREAPCRLNAADTSSDEFNCPAAGLLRRLGALPTIRLAVALLMIGTACFCRSPRRGRHVRCVSLLAVLHRLVLAVDRVSTAFSGGSVGRRWAWRRGACGRA